jgi:L-histidine N-alpha-methyltransferase
MAICAPGEVGNGRIGCRHVAAAREVPGIVDDVRAGLLVPPRSLPPKYFYDERGSMLFDRICETPEYYLTRTEDALLDGFAEAIIAITAPDDILELGSGMSRKTRRLLAACDSRGFRPSYSPFDISEEVLRLAADELVRDHEWLRVNLLVGDYEAGLAHLPDNGGRRLACFLGSTIGNLEHDSGVALMRDLRRHMKMEDFLLLGADRVKDEKVLHAAYNDSEGLTAAFNLNLLNVLNHAVDCDFDPGRFEHRAQFNAEFSRIEMHLVSRSDQVVRIGALDTSIQVEQGEMILTEISRKFTAESLSAMLHQSGFSVVAHFTPPDQCFSLVLARPAAA